MKKNQKVEIEKDLGLLAKSSIIVFIGLFLSKLFTYLYRIIIARYYGPEIYGVFSIAIMVLGFFVVFASLGFSEGLTRFIPLYLAEKKKEKIKYLLKFSNAILIISSLISAIILFFLAEFISINIFHEPSLILFLKIFSFLIPIQVFMGVYLAIIRANEKINAYSFGLNILQNFVKVILVAIFIWIGLNQIPSVSFSYFIGLFATFLFAYFYCKIKLPFRCEKILNNNEKRALFRNFFSYSWPLVFMGVIGGLLGWVDTFSIGFFKDAYQVGLYSAALPIAYLLVFAGDLFLQLFFPMITKEFSKKNKNVVKELSKQVNKWIFIINLPFLILLLLFPGVFINLFWGSEYLLAETALRFLGTGLFFFSFAGVSSSVISSLGKSKIILLNLVFVSLLDLILNFFLVPLYGINGAALATMISFVIWGFLLIIESYLFAKILPFRRKMFGVFLSAIIPTLILVYLSNKIQMTLLNLILTGIFFILLYLILIFVTKSFDKNDKIVLKKIKKRIFR